MTSQEKRQIKQAIYEGNTLKAIALLDLVDTRPVRSINQNSALHLYLTMVADELDKRGYTMQDVVKAIRRAEIRPTMIGIKEVVWKPLQAIITGVRSTTQVKSSDIDRVYETMNKWLGDNFDGLHVPFPSNDNRPSTLQNIKTAKKINYPDNYDGEPTI